MTPTFCASVVAHARALAPVPGLRGGERLPETSGDVERDDRRTVHASRLLLANDEARILDTGHQTDGQRDRVAERAAVPGVAARAGGRGEQLAARVAHVGGGRFHAA